MFLAEHRRCGEMDGRTDEEWLWMTCTCGAIISRMLEPARVPLGRGRAALPTN
jgi:hypothetical protein